ncbi:hypothetical protein PCASD_15545 [Puccinia coronata f. sp. avenae]|uniref:Uncharacterized protein n=1 Tax=Puccinia coronata f. sp. avenae TaxID=200324 RepID=A0A2N5U6F2_9BASI|nr:hypothetical protein PCASD_15545 [Puccinia coronata f. sp. avenae]
MPHQLPHHPNRLASRTASPNLKILQLNCHMSPEATLSALNNSPQFTFLVLQKPWINPYTLSPPKHREWRGYTSFDHRPKNWHDRHRMCIYVRTTINSQAVTQLSGGGQFLLALDVSCQLATMSETT